MSHDILNYGAVVIKVRINLYVLISFEKRNSGLDWQTASQLQKMDCCFYKYCTLHHVHPAYNIGLR